MKSTLFNMVMVLFVITLLASAGVGAVHMITEEPIPVGIWVRRTAESVVLTHCPPLPDARITSIRQSFMSICTSTSSASGITATVAVDVWKIGRAHV